MSAGAFTDTCTESRRASSSTATSKQYTNCHPAVDSSVGMSETHTSIDSSIKA